MTCVDSKDIKYVIVQAGGKGLRMLPLSKNKPKCLIPVDGKPLLHHLLDTYADKKVIVRADHHGAVLYNYELTFHNNGKCPTIVYVREDGTCGGLQQALKLIPDGEPFILTWSDLLFSNAPEFTMEDRPVIGLSNSFPCRWRYYSGRFQQVLGNEAGVAGFFAFPSKAWLVDCPREGSFVRDFLVKKHWTFQELPLVGVTEIGDIETLTARQGGITSRFFNAVSIRDHTVVKTLRDKRYAHLIDDEIRWYNEARTLGFDRAPWLLNIEYKLEDGALAHCSIEMQRIHGRHGFEEGDWSDTERKAILADYAGVLNKLHSYKTVEADQASVQDTYLTKTVERVNRVKGMIPFICQSRININGRQCRNPFNNDGVGKLAAEIDSLNVDKFTFIHGDPTFSNSLIDSNGAVWLIDPRGYFGKTKLYGDPAYDWAKLYYSVVGNYDSINHKWYELDVLPDSINVSLRDSGWSHLREYFFELCPFSRKQIELLHVLIWFALCGYVIEDYDSVLVSFYTAVSLWEDYLERYYPDGVA